MKKGQEPKREKEGVRDRSRRGAYVCARCRRRWIAVGNSDAPEPAHCACGANLRADELPAGVYEVVGPLSPSDEARNERPSKAEEPGPPLSQEADIGYGKSHGYGPGHGGPTGPGDAPAD